MGELRRISIKSSDFKKIHKKFTICSVYIIFPNLARGTPVPHMRNFCLHLVVRGREEPAFRPNHPLRIFQLIWPIVLLKAIFPKTTSRRPARKQRSSVAIAPAIERSVLLICDLNLLKVNRPADRYVKCSYMLKVKIDFLSVALGYQLLNPEANLQNENASL